MKILVNSLSKYILKVRKSAMANDKLKSTFLQPTIKLKEKVRGKDSTCYIIYFTLQCCLLTLNGLHLTFALTFPTQCINISVITC